MSEEPISRLRDVLKFKTVSDLDGNGEPILLDVSETKKFNQYITKCFSEVFEHSMVECHVVNELSILLHVRPPEPSDRDPFLFVAHSDVVPVDETKWKHPPFEAVLEDGFVYGRGALDDKGSLMAFLEALHVLMRDNSDYLDREFFVALTHDEEIQGFQGAANVSLKVQELLQGRELEFILDEGLIILEDFKAVLPPMAFIGVCEKGYMDCKLSVNTDAGHSSIPPVETAVTQMAEAVVSINRTSFPLHFGNSILHMTLSHIAAYLPFIPKIVLKLLLSTVRLTDWLWKPVLSLDRLTGNLMQTTKVCTMLRGGVQRNVIPSCAEAMVNVRLHPSDSKHDILARMRQAAGRHVTVEVVGRCWEPPRCSSVQSSAYKSICASIRSVLPHVGIAPGLLTGMTDSRHLAHLARDVYRFCPYVIKRSELVMIHGHNERISVTNYRQVIAFYTNFLLREAFSVKRH